MKHRLPRWYRHPKTKRLTELRDLAREYKLPVNTLRSRLLAGLDIETALTKPISPTRRNRQDYHSK